MNPTNAITKAAKTAKAVIRLIAFAVLSILIVGAQTIILPLYRGAASYILPRWWQRGTRRIFGIRVVVEGTPYTDRQALYVANHLSYLDIPVIGSFLKASFVARGDLSRWPIFGYMSKMQQTIFISRKREDAEKGKEALEQKLREGKSLIIFAEGTSSDGATVLPFKSSLFTLALDNPTGKPLMVQPITISLLSADGRDATSGAVRDLYAWHGDMTLPSHIWAFARSKGAVVHVRFHPPRDAAHYTNRKDLCQDCFEDVSGGLQTLAKAA